MGAITNAEEDAAQLALVHAMPKDARKWIQHHFGNALAGALGGLAVNRIDLVEEAINHAVSDLRKITPPADRARIEQINRMMIKNRERR